MSIKYINGINERLTPYLTRTIYLNNRGNVTMMGKYDIYGQIEMLLCWRKPIKAGATGMGLPTWRRKYHQITESCTHMHYVEGVYYNNISMAQWKTTAAPVRWQWSHRSPTPSHRYIILFFPKKDLRLDDNGSKNDEWYNNLINPVTGMIVSRWNMYDMKWKVV